MPKTIADDDLASFWHGTRYELSKAAYKVA